MDPLFFMSRLLGRAAAVAYAPKSRRRFLPATQEDLETFSTGRPEWATRSLLPSHWRTIANDRVVLVQQQTWSEPPDLDQGARMVRAQVLIDARDILGPSLALTALVSETAIGDDALASAILGGPSFCPADVWTTLQMLSIHDGILGLEVETQVEHRIVDTVIDVLVRLVDRLENAQFEGGRVDVTKLLFENLRSSTPRARVDALVHLLERDGEGAQVARRIVEEAEDPELRLVVLRHDNRTDGLEHMVKDATVPAALRARALIHLVQRLPPERQGDAVMDALTSGVLDVVDEAIRIAGRMRYAPAGPSIARLVMEASPKRATAAVRALERIQGTAATPTFLSALKRREENLLLAAIDALGRVAGIEAVSALDVFVIGDVARDLTIAASAAIELIQARAPVVAPGALSLARAGEGALSVTTATRGALSDVDPSGETDR